MSEPGERWLKKNFPERWKARRTPHAFVPLPLSEKEIAEGHVCTGGCVCDVCWERRGDIRRRANPHRSP